MELEHSFTVPVPFDRAWDVLLDVKRVAPCMPGATITSVDGDEIQGTIKVKVGPINMTYAGTARFVERDRAIGVVRLEATGRETRGAGTASATVRSELKDRGEQTDVVVLTTLNVTGKPAQFGRGVMNEVGGRLLTIFSTNLAALLAEPEAADAEAADAAALDAAGAAGSGVTAAPATTPGAAATAEPAATADSAAAAVPVDELGLPARAVASLRRAGLETAGQLAAATQDELIAIDGIGPASVDEIRAKLADRGLTLGQPRAAEPASAADSAAAAADGGVGTAQAEVAEAHQGGNAGQGTRATASATGHQMEEDAINLLRVAGMPVLKRALPVLAGLVAVLLLGIRKRLRRH
jgi:carbon monoxide dehydrogenase subunit G